MSHTYTQLLIHIVFATAERASLITPEIREQLYPYIGGTMRDVRAIPMIVNGTANHVHMLVSVPASLSVADLVRVVKANSSRWIHERWPERKRFAWQQGYGAFSVSESTASQVEKYIREQEEHHREFSFEQEFRVLLRKHNIEVDERYLWV
jgi:REP element-mobilizing transposase RayT